MKGLTAFVAILAIATLAAYAGPYFEIENVGLVLEPSFLAGWDFDVPFVEFTNMSISGDFYVTNDDLIAYPSPWLIGGFDLGFSFCNAVARDWIEVGLGMDMKLKRKTDTTAKLKSWATTLSVESYPSDVVTIYGLVECDYVIGTATWTFTPTIGLECRRP